MKLATLDMVIFVSYVFGLLALAYYVSREKAGHTKNTQDYFLASKQLPWWAIGGSLIAANISAEQIIGMSGAGYKVGLAIASYEWMGAVTLLIVAKYLLPIFLKKGIYTMPQFLEQRFDTRVRTVMAMFWLGVYTFVNLTAILWLGALAINTLLGIEMWLGMIFLALFSVAYSFYGGLKAVAYTDIIQVTLLVAGGLFLTFTALSLIGNGQGAIHGFSELMAQAPAKFDMILEQSSPYYQDLPGLSVLLGGMWVMNLSYWGFNQYIIQRTLAAKDLSQGQKGIAFAAFLKLLMPLLVVVPGIAAAVLSPDLSHADMAYPHLMTLMPVGLKGLIFAALIAAIVSSVASMTNSIATIFTMDIYRHSVKNKSQQHYVMAGRLCALVALILALFSAKPLLGSFDQAYQYIQEFTGFFTPGIVVLFLFGMFSKTATANGALCAAIGSAVFSLLFKLLWPELPFMDRVGIVFIICSLIMIGVSKLGKKAIDATGISAHSTSFETTASFNYSAVLLILILSAFYISLW